MKKLNERALRPAMLKDLIHPIFSVDEYTSKIGENNVVVAFQVLDNFDAAYDLSSFIEKSPVGVIDTEASETPNVDGRYIVFSEFERDGEFPQKLLLLLKTIENICPNPGWKIQLYGVNDPIDVDFDIITQKMELVQPDRITEFFDPAGVSVDILEETIRLNTMYGPLHFQLGSGIVSESFVKGLLNDKTQLDNTRLSSILGEGFDVLRSGKQYIVGNREGQYFVLR
jgi:hypothetical protein